MITPTNSTISAPGAVTSADSNAKLTPVRITEAIQNGLKLLAVTQDVSEQRLQRIATAIGEKMTVGQQPPLDLDPSAVTRQINPLFEKRQLAAIFARIA